MIKFVLISVTAVLMILGIYTYSNQTSEKSSPIPTISEKQIEVKETEKVSVVSQEVTEKKSSAKNITVKSPKVVSEKPTIEENSQDRSYADIENDSELSDQEKDMLIAAKAYYEVLENNTPSKLLTEEETIDMINNDEFIKQLN